MLFLYAISATLSLATACIPSSLNTPSQQHPQKRDAQYEDFPIDIDTAYGPINLPPQFLPPPWSPHSNLDSLYRSNTDTQIDDNGRSQMIDNEPAIWRHCPQFHLDCRKCPRDSRCRRPQFPEIHGETSMLDVAGADIPPEDDGQSGCPLQKCDDERSACGRNARCTRGFCVCKAGWKGLSRGNGGLGAVTVYNNPGTPCDEECDDLSCKEVEQLEVGACYQDGESSGVKGYDGQEADNVGSGSVHLPEAAAVLGMVGDYVAGVAEAEAFGQTY